MRFKNAVPVIGTADVRSTIAYYSEELGFTEHIVVLDYNRLYGAFFVREDQSGWLSVAPGNLRWTAPTKSRISSSARPSRDPLE